MTRKRHHYDRTTLADLQTTHNLVWCVLLRTTFLNWWIVTPKWTVELVGFGSRHRGQFLVFFFFFKKVFQMLGIYFCNYNTYYYFYVIPTTINNTPIHLT